MGERPARDRRKNNRGILSCRASRHAERRVMLSAAKHLPWQRENLRCARDDRGANTEVFFSPIVRAVDRARYPKRRRSVKGWNRKPVGFAGTALTACRGLRRCARIGYSPLRPSSCCCEVREWPAKTLRLHPKPPHCTRGAFEAGTFGKARPGRRPTTRRRAPCASAAGHRYGFRPDGSLRVRQLR